MCDTSDINQSYKVSIGPNMEKIGKKLYLNAKTADVHFSFGMKDGSVKRVPAHKNILAAATDVFEAMFYGKSKAKGDVHLDDVSDAAFTEFLQFFYLSAAELTIENIAGVMYLADKYEMTTCVKGCVEFLEEVLTVDNIFVSLKLAIHYDHQELMKFCDTAITLNAAEVFQTEGFLQCDRKALGHILQIDTLSCSEVEVFKACMEWVQAKSKQTTLTKAMVKKHLGDLFYEIRFKSMTMSDLCSLNKEYEPVLRNDFAAITDMIVDPDIQAETFSNQLRHAKWDANRLLVCDLVEEENALPYEPLTSEITTFSATEPLLLGSFECGKIQVENGSRIRDLKSNLPADVEISEVSSSNGMNTKVLLTVRTELKSSGANHILLPHPILIQPNLRYTISIGPFPAQHVYYSAELRKENRHKWAMVRLHDCHINQKDKVVGLISCLNFNSL